MKNLKIKGALNKMEQMEFKKLLLESALYLMSCDSEIADVEINEIKEIANKTTYFGGLDINTELNNLLPHFRKSGEIINDKYYHNLKTSDLSEVQELLLLEIILRITYSDQKLHENEIEFIRSVRSYFSVPDDVLIERFGKLDFLMRSTSLNVVKEQNITPKSKDKFS